MYLIIGLGNPEDDYANTRHNMGFNTINEISNITNIKVSKSKFDAFYGMGEINGQKVILIKPQTYMNLSGESIIKFKKFYKIANNDIIVIYDDMDLSLGDIKIRKKGGPGNHNGMKSVVENLKTEDFCRIRIGIGRPKETEDIINYVTGNIPKKEIEILDKSAKKASEAVIEILKNGVEICMNKFNSNLQEGEEEV